MKKFIFQVFLFLIGICSGLITRGQDIQIIRGSDYFDSTFVKASPKKVSKEVNKYHTVEKSQTLYSISKMYGVTVDEVKAWNNLKSNSISLGQKLIVGKSEKTEVIKIEKNNEPVQSVNPPVVKPTTEKTTENKNTKIFVPVIAQDPTEPGDLSISSSSSCEDAIPIDRSIPVESNNEVVNEPSGDKMIFGNGRREVNETGIALCMDEEDFNTEKYFAFHKKAPIGTIIMVINISNSQKIYVKVIGTLTDSSENDGAIIKVSKMSAEKLGVTGKKFEASLLYGVNEE